jgi:hypothetical protein
LKGANLRFLENAMIARLIPIPGEQLIDVPDIVQRNNWYCWCCSCCSVGRYWGVGPRDCDGWCKLLGATKKNPGEPQWVYDAFKKLGCQVAMGEGMTIETLLDLYRKGWPTICPIQEYMEGESSIKNKADYGHCVTVIGVGMGMVFVQDPSEDNVVRPDYNDSDNAPGRAMITQEKWNDVWWDREWKKCGISIGPPPSRRTFQDLS